MEVLVKVQGTQRQSGQVWGEGLDGSLGAYLIPGHSRTLPPTHARPLAR